MTWDLGLVMADLETEVMMVMKVEEMKVMKVEEEVETEQVWR